MLIESGYWLLGGTEEGREGGGRQGGRGEAGRGGGGREGGGGRGGGGGREMLNQCLPDLCKTQVSSDAADRNFPHWLN